MKSVDITTLANYDTIPLGEHKLTITAQADGYVDSDPSEEVTFINGYSIGFTYPNCSFSPHTNMISVFEDTVFTFTANTGYNLPDAVTVTGADHTWDKSTGKLTITNVTGPVAVTVTATQPQLATPTNVSVTDTTLSWDTVENAESYDILADGVVIGNTTGDVTYTITTTVTNGTYTGDTSIAADGTASITITANEGYTLPDEVTVTGATGTWNKDTGTLSISNPTGNVTVTAECVAEQVKISIKYNDDIIDGIVAYSLDGGTVWSEYINSKDVRLSGINQIKFKSKGLDEGLQIYQGGYDLSSAEGTEISPGYPKDKKAFETENIIISNDAGFFLVCYYD